MGGSNRIVIQDRDRSLLKELSVLRIIDREQAKRVGGFHSTTRANTRLLALTSAGLLRRFFIGTALGGKKALYALSSKGAQLVGVPNRSPRRKNDAMLGIDAFVNHQLAINEIFCAVKYRPADGSKRLARWEMFTEPIARGTQLVPDGYFEIADNGKVLAAFLEVDLSHEGMLLWKTKTQNYLQYALSGEFERWFSQNRFRVLVVTDSARTLSNIRNVVRRLTDKIFWFATFETINREGIWSPVWLRPNGDTPQALL
jgi:hypothetical protein